MVWGNPSKPDAQIPNLFSMYEQNNWYKVRLSLNKKLYESGLSDIPVSEKKSSDV